MAVPYIDVKIYLALSEHLENMSGAPAIAFPSDELTPNVGLPWLIFNDVRIDTPRKYIETDSPDELRGVVVVDIMTPLNWTYPQMLGISGQVTSRFSKDTIIASNGIEVQILDAPQLTDTMRRDSSWNRTSISISWVCTH